jgi:hypothetical protein
MLSRGLVTPTAAWAYFESIAPRLYRYPAVDPATFRTAMRDAFGDPPA